MIPSSRMEDRLAGSKYFRWSLKTRLLLIETLTKVDKDQEFKLRTANTAIPPLTWDEVASRLPSAFNAIDPTQRWSKCYAQFVKLQQRLKLMGLDHRNHFRRADGTSDPIMTNELCWKMVEYQDTFLHKDPGDQVAVRTNDNLQLWTAATPVASVDHAYPLLEHGHGEDVPAINDKQLCTVHPMLPASPTIARRRGRLQHQRQSQKSCKRGDPEMRLCKIKGHTPRSGFYRWSEDARLHVIQGVRMMKNNLSQGGQIKSWRDVAASLPKNLFWDMDLDQLAKIVKKQFSEMRRRYRVVKENQNSGASPTRSNTLTKRLLQEMDKYEQGCLPRPLQARQPAVRKLCNRKRNILWITRTPSQALHTECPGAHGAVLVEIISRSRNGIENGYRGVLAEFDADYPDPDYDAYGRDENSIVPSDGERENAGLMLQTVAEYSYSNSEEHKNSESGYSKSFESESDHYVNEWEAQDLTNRERKEGSFCSENGQEYLDLQCRRMPVPSPATSTAAKYLEPYHGNYRDRYIVEECLRRQRGSSSSAISISSADSDRESENLKIIGNNYLRKKEGSLRGYIQARSADVDSEESFQAGQYRSEGNDETGNEKLSYESKKDHFQRHWQRGIRPLATNERDSYSDENPRNSTESSNNQSESRHSYSDEVEYDSASTNESRSQGDEHCLPHFESRNNTSESENFVQSESIDKFLYHDRPQSLKWKASAPAHSQWDENVQRGHDTSQSNHLERDHHRARPPSSKRAKTKGEVEHRQVIPSGTAKMTDSSGSDQDQASEGPPLLNKLLKIVDLEFSRLNWWVQHQLLPMEREKITEAIKSGSIPNTLNMKRLGSEGQYSKVVKKCRQKRIRWVLQAEFHEVRLRLRQEIDKRTQVVIQEILQSFKT